MTNGLAVCDVGVRFGGRAAVDGLSLAAPTGRITALIGPNGAGKTTTFNVCSGLLAPTTGSVEFDGRTVTKLAPAARARLGMGRTYQRIQLFDSLTVAENVALGREAGVAGSNPLRQLLTRPGETASIAGAVESAIALCGIEHLVDQYTGNLSTGQRRLVELARVLAGQFTLLLLDEPSSGLDRNETALFGEILTRVVAERGIGILLVEHDMALVLSICEYIYVLDFGRLIFDGSAEEVRQSEIVQAAYLGSPDVTHEVPA